MENVAIFQLCMEGSIHVDPDTQKRYETILKQSSNRE